MPQPDADFEDWMDAQEQDNSLRSEFDKLLAGKPAIHPHLRKALLEAFMAGAAAYDRIMVRNTQHKDPQHLARVLDGLVIEIENRHKEEVSRP